MMRRLLESDKPGTDVVYAPNGNGVSYKGKLLAVYGQYAWINCERDIAPSTCLMRNLYVDEDERVWYVRDDGEVNHYFVVDRYPGGQLIVTARPGGERFTIAKDVAFATKREAVEASLKLITKSFEEVERIRTKLTAELLSGSSE